jgi:uncharacterized protein (DUF1800 family)
VIPQASSIRSEDRPLHVLNRLGFGPRQGDVERIKSAGIERYIDEQLHPDSIPEPAALAEQIGGFDTLLMTPVELFLRFQPLMAGARKGDKEAQKEVQMRARETVQQAMAARIIRAIEGPRQLQEVMTAFWFNHFNVFADKGLDRLWVGAYEEQAIRPHAMGKFRVLLGATARHPAMLFYLDNWLNTAPDAPGKRGEFEGINENYARELMELHTLGVNGGYSQQDVIALARILTGWGFPKRGLMRRRFGGRAQLGASGTLPVYSGDGFYFDPSRHDFSDKTLLGHRIGNWGIAEGEQALDILARSPATANHLSYQLAQYFVADNPPPALVRRMAARYLATDGDIRAVLETLLLSNRFWDHRYYRCKFKTPYEFVISAVRATGIEVRNFRPLTGTMAMLGMPLYRCQTPDGYKNTQQAWLNPEAMMIRLSFATALGAGRLPLGRPAFDDDLGGSGMMRAGLGAGAANRMSEMNGDVGSAPHVGAAMEPGLPQQVAATLGNSFSAQTRAAIEAAPPRLRASLILGSPEFMMR